MHFDFFLFLQNSLQCRRCLQKFRLQRTFEEHSKWPCKTVAIVKSDESSPGKLTSSPGEISLSNYVKFISEIDSPSPDCPFDSPHSSRIQSCFSPLDTPDADSSSVHSYLYVMKRVHEDLNALTEEEDPLAGIF